MTARVALIDSGVNASHPHVVDGGGTVRSWRIEAAAGGPWSARTLDEHDDRMGHGTAAAAAILDLAPGARIDSIQVFEDGPSAVFERVLCALDHALELAPDLCNLSLGTTRDRWCTELEPRLARFVERGIPLVSPAFWRGLPSYPGCLPGCHGVREDAALERAAPEHRTVGGRQDWFASPYPRDLPGLPRSSNLAGVSMACANLSGYLLRGRV